MAENVKRKTKAGAKPGKQGKRAKKKAESAQLPEITPKSVLTRLLGKAHAVEEAIASERGTLGQQVQEATARHNLHPWAFRVTRRLQKMSDLKRAEAWYQLKAYVEALGLDQGDLFRDATNGGEHVEPAEQVIPLGDIVHDFASESVN